jgi:hypothetical protein
LKLAQLSGGMSVKSEVFCDEAINEIKEYCKGKDYK